MLLCECLSVLAGHCVVWLFDFHSLKFWLFVSNLFATPALGQSSSSVNSPLCAMCATPGLCLSLLP